MVHTIPVIEQINNNKIQHLFGHDNHSTRIHKMK